MSQLVPLEEQGFIEQVDQGGILIGNVSHWAKTKIFVHVGLHHAVSLGEGDVHLDGALAVPQVVQLLVGGCVDVGENCRQIVVSHVLESELPKLLVFVGVVLHVLARVFVASAVPHPHIISRICQDESKSFALFIKHPSI